MPGLMYMPHPVESKLTAFVPESLVRASENDVAVSFHEFLEMRRVIEQIAGDLQKEKPDLIPFFATGGIPFMFPAMHVLCDRKERDLLDGRHFHMFPGLSWGGTLDGLNAEAYFAGEFGKLVAARSHEGVVIRIWTMDATFTGNAIRKLLTALHRTFLELSDHPRKASVSLLAVIDASRADRMGTEDKIPLSSPHGTLYLTRPAQYSPVGELKDHQPVRFIRHGGDDLFELAIEFRVVSAIPTEDRAELIGAVARKESLGVAPEHQVGRLTVNFDNGYAPSSTGGGSLGGNVLNHLSRGEDRWPWVLWKEVAALPPLTDEERESYEEAKAATRGGLSIYELRSAPAEEVAQEMLAKAGLLEGAEVYCLKEHAQRRLKERGVQPTCFPVKLLRKVLASARASPDAVADAVDLFRTCRLDLAPDEPHERGDEKLLDWWDAELRRD